MTSRPGGRTAAVRAAVLTAAAGLLAENGLHGLDLTAVADRAGVGKTTVYRRWGSVPALVADLLVDMAETSTARPTTGTLRGDLLSVARLIQRTLADRRQGPLFKAVIAAATCDSATAAALAGFYRTRLAELGPIVEDAVERGEAPAGTNAADVIRHVSAPLYYRLLTDATPPRPRDAERAVGATLAAVAAGVFRYTDERD
ncbi:TetR/AcrR family transcriptional regulator [Mycolicibacterium bacteremicum]|uniref:TetR family transcriptional regulator n=1 Tax=Mycolicibacterium bacteremicum TaxID=564198 RepID=A0A1W9YN53_MYCBA|nr:TetR/AcrR family transcriptional regulator [Mycolicibacterium bacteremicum]MCV7430158.1 TetR/AcrR family transcriptional regulator [Mycolicibacterium bacteremicum]ORA01475.1 TetR family transcriptional regulator [Mycolicibacterium bacteremicum]